MKGPSPTDVTLIAVGDIMLGDGPACAGHGVGSTIRRKGFIPIFENVEPLIKRGDIAFGNLESVISNNGVDSNGMQSFLMRASPDTLNGLIFAGFNLLSLANNHTLEYGVDGLNETVNHLAEYNINYIGVGNSVEGARTPFFLTVRGIKFAFLAYCLIPDKTAYISTLIPDEILSDINKAKANADLVIVSLHWGNEFIEIPSPKQIQFAHQMIDEGASLILGHHPHILQGIEQYHDGLIAYSLGNFIFDVNYIEELRHSIILECRFDRTGIIDYELHPVYINKNYCPIPLVGEEKNLALLKFTNISSFSGKINGYDNQKYEDLLAVRRRSVKRRMKIYFARNIYRYNWTYAWHILTQYIIRKFS